MSRIVHLALKVEDLEKATAFYQNVFGFREVHTHKHSDHVFRAPDGIVAELVPAGRYEKGK